MRKGTTPTLTFKLPFAVSQLANAKITIRQNGVSLSKKLSDCKTTEDTITVKLTQEETFLFDNDSVAEVQLRVVTENKDALATEPYKIFIAESLDDEVIE